MSRKAKAIVLGGTVPHRYLIKNLKDRGYETILVDYHANPPAKDEADRHIQASTLDLEQVLAIAKEEEAALVIAGCVDQANLTACFVAEKLNLPHPYSYKAGLRVTDKELMKEGLIKAGVATAAHSVVTSQEIQSFTTKQFPKVVKPCDCNGSKGVQKVSNQKELTEAIQLACELSRTNKAIVEEFIEGLEINAYFYIQDGIPYLLYTKSKKKGKPGSLEGFMSFASLGPMNLSEQIHAKLHLYASSIAKEFNLNNTPLLVQAIFNGTEVDIIEFAPRVGGGLAFREIKMLRNFDFIDAVVSSYLSETVSMEFLSDVNDKISVVHFFGTHGKLSRIEGDEVILAKGLAEEIHLHKTFGMEMTSKDLSSRNRVLGMIVRGESEQSIENKVFNILNELKILDEFGLNSLNKELFNNFKTEKNDFN
jgi:biotin carboxylase